MAGYVACLQRFYLFLLSNKMLVFRAGSHKILIRIANREDPDQTAPLEFSRPFCEATTSRSVQNCRTFTIDLFLCLKFFFFLYMYFDAQNNHFIDMVLLSKSFVWKSKTI